MSISASAYTQVGIGTSNPDTSALLDITTTTQGLLIPRMTNVERQAISNPQPGLMVFDTDSDTFMVYNGSGWTNLSVSDITAPSLTAVTEVVTPSNDTTPSYVFTTNEAGTITTNISEGFSTNASAANGNNTVTFNTLAEGKYESKTVTVTDAAGNASSLTLTTFDIDTTAPTMTITATEVSDGETSNDATIALTLTSSESTTNFDVNDITVTNGTLSSFTGSGTAYTATFTPSAEGATTINVVGGAFTDLAGNNNDAATQFTWTYEATSTPTLGTPWTVDLGGSHDVEAVLVSGDYAYVSKHASGITMVDISDPTDPNVVSTFSNGNTNGDMYIYTCLLYTSPSPRD